MTPESIVEAVLKAARQARDEEPRIGIANSHEWATVGRIAVWLGRQPEILALEQQGIFVDTEYGQMNVAEIKNINGRDVRIDMLVHRRGLHDANMVACEVKMSNAKSRCIEKCDRIKLEKLTTEYGYQLGLWISLPRQQGARNRGRYVIVCSGVPRATQDL